MNLSERLNVLIQATTLSQKNGALTFDDAVKAKSAIDIISAKTINQNFTSAINVLIEIAVSSQKKGVYSLKDAYMLYLAINGIEAELQNEVNRLHNASRMYSEKNAQNSHVLEYSNEQSIEQPVEQIIENDDKTIVVIPPVSIPVG